MRTSDRGVFALALHEGIVPAPYLDSVGVWTYGIGHTAAAGAPDPEQMDRGVPADLDSALKDVFEVFRRDLVKYEDEVFAALSVPVAQHEFDALVSFHYNTGGIRRAKLTKLLNAGSRAAAADAFMGWARPKEIIKRRKQERSLFRDAVYPDGVVVVWGATDEGKVVWRAIRHIGMADFAALMKPAVRVDPPGVAPAPKRPQENVAIAAAVGGIAAAIAGWWDSIVSFFGG